MLKRGSNLFTGAGARSVILATVIAGAVIAPALFLSAGILSRPASSADSMPDLPKIILWAWERPEDLSFIDTRRVGVAFLAGTLYLKDDGVIARPRLQPLAVPPEAAVIAVVRIESARANPAALSPEQRAEAASRIAALARGERLRAVQVDFDARLSERAFYRDLLFDLRRLLPSGTRLSITALASWCVHDDWIAGLPVDEAVPMLFRMGADHHAVENHLKAGGDFGPASARLSLGISTDEPLERLPSGRRVYVFNPRPWTEQTVSKITREVKLWQ